MALLAKWIWILHKEKDALWRKLIAAIYSTKHLIQKIDDLTLQSTKGPWKFIKKQGAFIFTNIRFKVGNGIDLWVRQRPMMRDFPLLYYVATNKSITIADLSEDQNRAWNMTFRRNIKEDEWGRAALLTILSTFYPSNREDFWMWNLEKNGSFTVKPFTHSVSIGTTPHTTSLYKAIWKATYPRNQIFYV